MTDEIFYVLAGFILGVMIIFIAYKLVMVSIKYMQNQAVLRDFEDLYESMEQICMAGVGNGIGISYEIPVSVKAVYATDFAEEYVDGL
ncbi:MAG: hypothetical protein QXO84_03895, partial [Candidatus Aenigmatarchaeota archaeon]